MRAGVAAITGAGRGIGRAIALRLARRGLDVSLFGRNRGLLDEVARAIVDLGQRAHVFSGDVRNLDDLQGFSRSTTHAFGVPRVVVCNAGVVERARVESMSPEAWDAVVDTNLKGAFLTAQAFLPGMRDQRTGRIITLGSISGTLGTAGQSAYCASKWGLVGFTRSLAEELRGSGLQALCVMPGSVDTDMLMGSGFSPQMTADDVARVVEFAALDAPDAMNASSLEMFGP